MASDVAQRVAEALLARGETLAVAESSTGGLILSLLTDIPGASGWLGGGVVAYTNASKQHVLGVTATTLAIHGAVSGETAMEMARGVRELFRATWALGETGIAGPQTGRRSAKLPGLTYIAVHGAPHPIADGQATHPAADGQATHPIAGGQATHPAADGQAMERVVEYHLPDPGDRVAVKAALAQKALTVLLDLLIHQANGVT